jgi:hypothetical protein
MAAIFTSPAVRLGKRPARFDPRTLRMAKYLPDLHLAPSPPAVDFLSGMTDWGMMENDQVGDCTIAGCGHAVQVWYAATGTEFTLFDSVILDAYERWCGYVPDDPATDQGGVELDVLNCWRQEGLGGESIVAYVDPDLGNVEHIRKSIELFGLVYIGLQLPLTAQRQAVWEVVPDAGERGSPGSWGGHCVVCPAYDEDGLTCITWGKRQKMTWNFWKTYCDEAHTILSEVWLDRAPVDFHYANLMADLAAVGS